MPKHRGISRIDSKRTHGWFVRIYRDGKTISKFFSDGKYGGKRKALQLAIEHRDALEKKYPLPFIGGTRRPFFMKPPKNNTSGVCGVSETFKRQRNGKKTPYFSVSWYPEPHQKVVRSINIDLYGHEEAFEMAVKLRKDAEEEILRKRHLKRNPRVGSNDQVSR